MAFQVTLNSRNVLVPVTLEGRDGARLDLPPSPLDTATALVIAVSTTGGFSQEFIPLSLSVDPAEAYSGREWELRSHRAGRDHHVFYLGVPDRWFAADGPQGEPKSLSVQVVGSSAMTGREDYSGGVDVTLQAEVAHPLIPGFLNLSERFFPTLLPHNFAGAHVLDAFEFRGRRDLVLMASLQADPNDRAPVSFGKHWDPKNWVGAVVENLLEDAAPRGAYHVVKGGCFFGRGRRATHWFGGSIGLEERSFRAAAAEWIRSLSLETDGAWVFWLEPQEGAPGAGDLQTLPLRGSQARFSVRHPMLHRLVRRASARPAAGARPGRADQAAERSGGAPASIARLPAESAVSALARAARILVDHQAELHRARTEPAHALWSEEALAPAALVAGALAAAEGSLPSGAPRPLGMSALESAIRGLYRDEGEALRTLESVFDETSGYAAWDAQANPLRESLAAYLSEGQETRAPA